VCGFVKSESFFLFEIASHYVAQAGPGIHDPPTSVSLSAEITGVHYYTWVKSVSLFCCGGDLTQGLAHARQALYH
jgi:hypothetical protein